MATLLPCSMEQATSTKTQHVKIYKAQALQHFGYQTYRLEATKVENMPEEKHQIKLCSTVYISLQSSSTIFLHCQLNTEAGFRTSEKPSRQKQLNTVFRMFLLLLQNTKKNKSPPTAWYVDLSHLPKNNRWWGQNAEYKILK